MTDSAFSIKINSYVHASVGGIHFFDLLGRLEIHIKWYVIYVDADTGKQYAQ